MSRSAKTFSWTYEGKEKDLDDELANVTIAKPGGLLRYDIFDMCEMVGDGESAGMLKVKVLEDGSVRNVTSGHFQELSSQQQAAQQVRAGPGTNNDGIPGDQVSTGAGETASAAAQPSDDLKATTGNGKAGSNAGKESGSTGTITANDSEGGNKAGDSNPVPEEGEKYSNTNNEESASALFNQVVKSMQAQSVDFKLDA
eukprot:4450584-Pleurochrysis_carterae.AAC.1